MIIAAFYHLMQAEGKNERGKGRKNDEWYMSELIYEMYFHTNVLCKCDSYFGMRLCKITIFSIDNNLTKKV